MLVPTRVVNRCLFISKIIIGSYSSNWNLAKIINTNQIFDIAKRFPDEGLHGWPFFHIYFEIKYGKLPLYDSIFYYKKLFLYSNE